MENVEVQRRWWVEFGTTPSPPPRVTITRIRDKFEVWNGARCDERLVRKKEKFH